nr:hypothetical protein [Tanacetum cinerariifolium]
MALPKENLLTFSQYKNAKTLFEAIQARFGGNDATKKTQKTLMKQMYENFNAPNTESLEFIFNRLKKIVSQLAILGENISHEDLNMKFLRSLPTKWNTHVVVWRNKPDLEIMSFDDLYNNFKIIEQEVKRTVVSISSSGSLNMAFLSSPSSTNEVDTASIQVSVASTPVSTVSSLNNTANLSDATVYAFLANQPNGSQLVDKDLDQIYEDDLEEMDLKWQLALLSMRARRYFQRTGKKITINRSDTAGYDKTKVECFNCPKMRHFTRECRSPRSQESFDWSYMGDDEVLTNMALMAFSDSESVCLDTSNLIKKVSNAPIIEDWVSDYDEDESEEVTVEKRTGQREVSPVWNHAMRVNHQNFSNSRKNFAPTAVLTKPEVVPISTARQSSSRVAAPVSTARLLILLHLNPAPIISFMRPFGRPVNFLKTLNHLGKFDGKADEGFLVGYFINSKAFKVYNSRTKKVEENLHVKFLENKPNVTRSGPKWLFDIDSLTNSMNYQPISARNRTNSIEGLKIHSNVGQDGKENVFDQEYILLTVLNISSDVPSSNEEVESSTKDDAGKKSIVEPTCVEGGKIDDLGCSDQQRKRTDDSENTNSFNTASPTINTASDKDGTFQRTYGEWNISKPITINAAGSSFSHPTALDDFSKMSNLEDTEIFDDAYDDRDEGVEGDYNNVKIIILGHRQEEGIDYDEVFALVAMIKAIRLFLAYASFMDFTVYQMNVKSAFLYGTIKAKVYVSQPLVKRIFRYLKGHPTLGLWYPKDSPLELIAYSDSDYTGASLDRKSTTE